MVVLKKINQKGFTLPELVISLTVFAAVATSLFALYISMVNSTVVAQSKAAALTLATNQMEYLKSLPYDKLAVAGGSIYAPNPLPASYVTKVNNFSFTVSTSINYVDDAYDGCTNYPTQQLKQLYCRNYPPPSGAPAVDSNPQDYKIVHVKVISTSGKILAYVDTEISAKVAETASATGALFVSAIDSAGNPVTGANIHVTNSVKGPVDVSDDTDNNGIAIFYGLPPDNSFDYVLTASKSGYSTLTTIAPSGSLQPNYPNQKIISQQSTYVTLPIKQQGSDSLLLEATDTSGNPIPGVKVYVKGGYKKYTATSDTSYYFDNMSPSDSRPTTDSSGLAAISNLVPGQYIICGDSGATSCSAGSTTYYLVAAVPYGGANSFNPVSVPIYDPANPPSVTFPYGTGNYLQKVRLILSTSLSHPRIFTMSPDTVSLSGGGLNAFVFQITGANLPCSASAPSCSTSISYIQGANTYTAACTGTTGTNLACSADLTGISAGTAPLRVGANGFTVTMPDSPLKGGLNVTP